MTSVRVTWRGAEYNAMSRRALAEAVTAGAWYLHARALELTPIQDGILRNSAQVVPATGGNPVARVQFNTPYAVIQHERTDFRHPQGGRAKYLESPLRQNREQILAVIAATYRRSTGG